MQKVDQAQTLSKPIQSQRSEPSFKQFLLVAGMLFNPVAASELTCPNQMTPEIFLGGVDPTDRNVGNLYRKWSLACHPDKNPGPNAEEQFRRLTDVRDSLVNTTFRNIDRDDEYSYEGFADVGDLGHAVFVYGVLIDGHAKPRCLRNVNISFVVNVECFMGQVVAKR